ncbi:MAG: hypothetical protein JEY79_06030 [Pseudodesulfovibrio sp.]|nr:hypothetical protein [Pseudodesulfovibrio sp.]
MKKVLFLLIVIISFSLAGCVEEKKVEAKEAIPSKEEAPVFKIGNELDGVSAETAKKMPDNSF